MNVARRIGVAGVAAVVGSVLLFPSPASGAAQEQDPCARLTAGEVRYSVADAKRVTFATAEKYGATETRLTGCVRAGDGYEQEWQSWGFSGRNGFATAGSIWENTLYSPTGSFTFTEALGRSNPGTKLEYHTLNPSSRWGGERGETYNQYFEGDGGPADENLWRYMEQGLYEQAAVINWNRQPDMPTRQGASFAIFFHAGYAPTWGCISTDLSTVVRLLNTAVPGDRIVMGTVEDVFAASTASSDDAAATAVRAEDRAAAVEQRMEVLANTALTLFVLVTLAWLVRGAFNRVGRAPVRGTPPPVPPLSTPWKTESSSTDEAQPPSAHIPPRVSKPDGRSQGSVR